MFIPQFKGWIYPIAFLSTLLDLACFNTQWYLKFTRKMAAVTEGLITSARLSAEIYSWKVIFLSSYITHTVWHIWQHMHTKQYSFFPPHICISIVYFIHNSPLNLTKLFSTFPCSTLHNNLSKNRIRWRESKSLTSTLKYQKI